MKKIEAIVQPFRADAVRSALADAGISGMTITEVKGYGRQKGRAEVYRGLEYAATPLPKVKIEMVVADTDVNEAVAAILGAARTGQIGDGKIFILNVIEAVRIRNGNYNEAAL